MLDKSSKKCFTVQPGLGFAQHCHYQLKDSLLRIIKALYLPNAYFDVTGDGSKKFRNI